MISQQYLGNPLYIKEIESRRFYRLSLSMTAPDVLRMPAAVWNFELFWPAITGRRNQIFAQLHERAADNETKKTFWPQATNLSPSEVQRRVHMLIQPRT
jgi:hypothetical protein